jgi:alpha-tubulin suppressor-like RCC1 family protein
MAGRLAAKPRSAAALLFALLATMGWSANGALASESGRVAAGGTHSCAIKADDTLVCWGGQGGVPAGLGSVEQVAAGGKHDCAIETADTPVCWGDDSKGQSTVPAGIGTVTQISAGEEHTCAVKTDGTPLCWGDDTWGQSTLPAGIGTVTQISAGSFNTCAVKTDGTPICWGDNSDGQNTIPAGIGTVTQVATTGEGHTCAIETDGTPICWGDNEFGEVTIPAGIGTVTQIVVGEWHTCAIETDGTPACWGRNAPIGPQPSLPSDIGTVTEISAGLYHTCAIKTDETVRCWGSHIDGQLGGSPVIDSPAPPALVGVGPFSHAYTAEPAMGGLGAGNLVIRFFRSSGSFPPGVALDETTGLLSGTPTADGTYSGVVSATNGVFSPDTQPFSITVDTTAPAAPSGLVSTPLSPSADLKPRILGTAEAGSTVRLYDNATCTGTPRSTGSAASLASPGLQITVAAGSTTIVYATATDAAGNTSGCSTARATYVNAVEPGVGTGGSTGPGPGAGGPPEPPACVVPKLAGKTLAQAKKALKAAACQLGTVRRPRPRAGRRLPPLVVRSSTPAVGASPAGRTVNLRLGPKPGTVR